jgi:fucose 4-O-acetylase-like acetyltransferase
MRLQWMDVCRGLSVVLIVIVHAGSTYSATGHEAVPGWIWMLDLAFAPYRVPLLMVLSGMLLSRSLAKGVSAYVKGKLRNLAWPFVIWTAIFVLAASGPQGWLAVKPWLGNTPLWYLAYLCFYFAIGLVGARVPFVLIAVYALAIAMVAHMSRSTAANCS